jgi:hypothetical protein
MQGRDKAAPEATKALEEVARRAQDLARKQAQIEERIEDRCDLLLAFSASSGVQICSVPCCTL